MKTKTLVVPASDGFSLFVRVWQPDGSKKRGILQIVHGMAEHSQRYEILASFLVESGWEVWAHDARGHGQTLSLNSEEGQPPAQKGFLAPKDGFFCCVEDVAVIASHIKSLEPSMPLFLMGHSWGSFQAQAAIERDTGLWDGCILSGTRGPSRALMGFGRILASLVMALRGPRRHSRLVWTLADGAYIKPFKPERTPFDWLSRDRKVVDAYIADPLCGFPCPVIFYRDLFHGLFSIHAPSAMARIRRDFPILILAGLRDPVGDMGKSPRALAARYAKLGLSYVSLNLYPEGRHEMLNELVRDQVHRDILSWLEDLMVSHP